MEDKQLICNRLYDTLMATRGASDILNIYYNNENETVEVVFVNGKRIINVACDSGVAMIRDIMNNLGI